MAGPLLCLTVDVEEDMPGWRIRDPLTVDNARALPKVADLCTRLGVQPTWLCTYPMVTHAESSWVLRWLAARGGCELGTHLHPWNTPPFAGIPGSDADERSVPSYLCDLGPAVFRAKLRVLHDAVAEVAGRAPVSFRAGRYGIDGPGLAVLAELGYEVDTSVTPLVSHADDGGPDFRSAPAFPYRPSRADATLRGDLPLVEVPVSVSLTRRVPAALGRLYARIPRATRLRGLLSRDWLGLVDFAWLYPARFAPELMRAAARVLVESGAPVLNVFVHSSELVAGASGRVHTDADAERTLAGLGDILSHCIAAFGAEPVTLREAGRRLAASPELAGPAAAAS